MLQLPASARVWAETFGPRAHWSTEHELLATVAELVDVGNYYTFQAYRARDKHGRPTGRDRPKPVRIPRPGTQSRERGAGPVSMDSPEAVQFFRGRVRYTPTEPHEE